MKLWLKRGLLILACFLLLAILGSAVGYRQLKGLPDWYALRKTFTPAELEAAAHRVENKLTHLQNWAAERHAQEASASRPGAPAGTQMASTQRSAPADAVTLEFSEDELNAFFQKWVTTSGYTAQYERYFSDLAILLQENRLVLAGNVREVGTVISAYIDPSLDPQTGELRLKLLKVLGGRLPLPSPLWAGQRDKALAMISSQLPAWRREARIDPKGTANMDAVNASLGMIVMDLLADRSSPPVIFLPLAGRGAVPARISDLSIRDKTLSLTVQSMNAQQRKAYAALLHGTPSTPSKAL